MTLTRGSKQFLSCRSILTYEKKPKILQIKTIFVHCHYLALIKKGYILIISSYSISDWKCLKEKLKLKLKL